MNKERYIGIMSGTSMDGVDVVLCEIDASHCKLLAEYEHPFPPALKEEILQAINGSVTLQKVGEIDHKLGVLFADAVNVLMQNVSLAPETVCAIGSHGQTLWHQPSGKTPFSMQLGDPNIITARTGMRVVTDFRRKDMALGGSGAPFAPAFHAFLLGSNNGSMCVVNIGGIANITVLDETLLGYDTGPGNMLMDAWIMQHKGVGYDKEGAWAREGRVNYRLLDAMMEDAYFSAPYSKSTGREKFNLDWLENVQRLVFGDEKTIAPIDMQRTLLELTALSISNEVLKFNPDMLLLCGGGTKNSLLVERIAALMPNIQVGIMEQADSLEAMMMAWLAYKRLHNEPVNLKHVTGAKENTILGGVYQ